MYRRVFIPPGMFSIPGGQGRPRWGSRTWRPRHHLPVSVLGLGPAEDGGHSGHQTGEQTTTGMRES